MGQFHFDVPEPVREFFRQSLWRDAYLCGIEGVPWQSHAQFESGRLTVRRGIDSSGKLYLACPVPGLGYRTLSTCSLRPLKQPHLLALELARGSCHRARTQSDIWIRSGLTVGADFESLMAQGTAKFLDAAQCRNDPGQASNAALEAIGFLERALMALGEAYAVQSISFRKQNEDRIGTLLAGTLVPPSPDGSPLADDYCATFNSAVVRLNWVDIESDSGKHDYEPARTTIQWCASKGLRVIGGPLIDFRERLLPQWLYLIEDDFESFLSAARQFVERTVGEFRGSVQLWNCAAGLNTPGPLELDDEQIMRLALVVLQAVRRTDPNTPAVLTFDQPFGEYLAKHRNGISPLHFADALARSGLGMAGLGLEVRVNYTNGGTLPRSAVEFGEMIDRWATLGMPLLVQIGVPGGSGADAQAMIPSEPLKVPGAAVDHAAEQLRIAGPLIRTLLAKHVVHGVVWDGWSDVERHVVSHSGLIAADGTPRPLLGYLTRLRRDFLT